MTDTFFCWKCAQWIIWYNNRQEKDKQISGWKIHGWGSKKCKSRHPIDCTFSEATFRNKLAKPAAIFLAEWDAQWSSDNELTRKRQKYFWQKINLVGLEWLQSRPSYRLFFFEATFLKKAKWTDTFFGWKWCTMDALIKNQQKKFKKTWLVQKIHFWAQEWNRDSLLTVPFGGNFSKKLEIRSTFFDWK